MLSHGNLASNAAALRDAWRFTADDRPLHALPIFHTHGLFVATNITLMAGGSLIYLPRFDLADMMRPAEGDRDDGGADLLHAPPVAARLHPRAGRAHAPVRLGLRTARPRRTRSSAPAPAHAILERYGMTETNMNTSNPYDGDRIPGSVGQPLPGVEIRITDPETGAVLPQGDIGMIEVRGPNVFKGYWRMPEKTKAEFREDGHPATSASSIRAATSTSPAAART